MSAELTQPVTDAAQPKEGTRPVPVWLLVLLFLLLYWAMVYFDQRGAWFNEEVYAPYHSLDEVVAFQPPSGGPREFVQKGKVLYGLNCAVCHMEGGTGNPANGCPNLLGSEWVSAPGPGRIIRIVSKGATGPIEVNGKVWSSGTMLAIGDQMPGDEKQKAESIAAIICYIRQTFGNKASLVTPEEVAAVRDQIKSKTTYYSPEELKAAPDK
jgi:mono/diheme cytochrome c family protein